MENTADVVIIGAGAAGLMSAIWAGRSNLRRKIIILEGAKKPGAKILVSGGGRCNVTHFKVEANDFAGSSRNAIKKVLKRFNVQDTIHFFQEIGVSLKKENTGKLFPVTDSSKTVLQSLWAEAIRNNIQILYPSRVDSVKKNGNKFIISGEWGKLEAKKLILATGGRSLPKTGSDGKGYEFAKFLGHSVTKDITSALVPLTVPVDHFIRQLTGITLTTTVELRAASGKKQQSFTDSMLCTHFGLSGPAILNISRFYLKAKVKEPDSYLVINWIPQLTDQELDQRLQNLNRLQLTTYLHNYLPDRLIQALFFEAGVDPQIRGNELTKKRRKKLVNIITQMRVSVTGSRGFKYAEVTAGGVPLNEIHLDTMESRICPGLFLCGEICDVDGRIGGFNFQWAWSSGYTAGISV